LPYREKAKLDKQTQGEFESERPGYCMGQDAFYVGSLKGLGRLYQRSAIDTEALRQEDATHRRRPDKRS
jgi:hypothetical protein